MKVTAQQKEMLKTIVQRLINLEYQLKNTDHITKIEVSAAKENYAKDKDLVMQLILIQAKDLNYPPIQDWADSKPMSQVNDMADGNLAATDFYQEILGRIMLGTITST